MIKKSLIALAIVVWMFVGSVSMVFDILKWSDVKVTHIPLIAVGAMLGPITFIVTSLNGLMNNDTILIHKAEKLN